tara:strand:- start:1099 stop:1293 length:195 start_codon:yes stop_codon:yes gene_type:complete
MKDKKNLYITIICAYGTTYIFNITKLEEKYISKGYFYEFLESKGLEAHSNYEWQICESIKINTI